LGWWRKVVFFITIRIKYELKILQNIRVSGIAQIWNIPI